METGIVLKVATAKKITGTGQVAGNLWDALPDEETIRKASQSGLRDTALEVADALADELNQLPWKGFIQKVEDNKAYIASGKDVGIRIGDQFVVHMAGEKITNAAGQTYVVPGQPKARLRAVRVGPDQAELEILSGEVHPGETVKFVSHPLLLGAAGPPGDPVWADHQS